MQGSELVSNLSYWKNKILEDGGLTTKMIKFINKTKASKVNKMNFLYKVLYYPLKNINYSFPA